MTATIFVLWRETEAGQTLKEKIRQKIRKIRPFRIGITDVALPTGENVKRIYIVYVYVNKR